VVRGLRGRGLRGRGLRGRGLRGRGLRGRGIHEHGTIRPIDRFVVRDKFWPGGLTHKTKHSSSVPQ
jgi:hypothetical protein